jgi:hypothetical protein
MAIAPPPFRTRKAAPVALERAIAVEDVEVLQQAGAGFEIDGELAGEGEDLRASVVHAAVLRSIRASLDSTSSLANLNSLTSMDEDAPGGWRLPPAVAALIDRVPSRARGLILLNLLVLLVATNWVVVKSAGEGRGLLPLCG